ncbi:hypothetical protein [Streptomyces sp. NPDC019224]|uniref:hypothetical protein n=1 Tax=Streptomyces sp. NPDC019224 TaxID=3154484 RepID=UPI0033F4A14F
MVFPGDELGLDSLALMELGAVLEERLPPTGQPHPHPAVRAPGAQQLETACRESGGTLFTGLLAAMAASVRDEGGPDAYRALVPVSLRGRHQYARSIGWFVNAVPVEIPAPRHLPLTALLPLARTAFEAGRQQADIHLVRAQRLLGHTDDPVAAYPSVSFLSYLDYRTAPGAEHPATSAAAVHLWSPACNGNLSWFHRTRSGLHLNTLHPDTPRARRTVASLVRTLSRTLRTLADGPGPLGAQPDCWGGGPVRARRPRGPEPGRSGPREPRRSDGR